MTMTPGERAIWAAAFVDATRDARERAVGDVQAGLSPRPRLDPYVRAAVAAGCTVQAARSALAKLVEMPVEEKWREQRAQEIEMLREMLGAPEVKLR